ncbi:unnamed protein product, partial [Phaeothamnion confervicola]
HVAWKGAREALMACATYGRGYEGLSAKEIAALVKIYGAQRIQATWRGQAPRRRFSRTLLAIGKALRCERELLQRLRRRAFEEWVRCHRAQLDMFGSIRWRFHRWRRWTAKRHARAALMRSCFWPLYVWRRWVNARRSGRDKARLLKRVWRTYVILRHFREWDGVVAQHHRPLKRAEALARVWQRRRAAAALQWWRRRRRRDELLRAAWLGGGLRLRQRLLLRLAQATAAVWRYAAAARRRAREGAILHFRSYYLLSEIARRRVKGALGGLLLPPSTNFAAGASSGGNNGGSGGGNGDGGGGISGASGTGAGAPAVPPFVSDSSAGRTSVPGAAGAAAGSPAAAGTAGASSSGGTGSGTGNVSMGKDGGGGGGGATGGSGAGGGSVFFSGSDGSVDSQREAEAPPLLLVSGRPHPDALFLAPPLPDIPGDVDALSICLVSLNMAAACHTVWQHYSKKARLAAVANFQIYRRAAPYVLAALRRNAQWRRRRRCAVHHDARRVQRLFLRAWRAAARQRVLMRKEIVTPRSSMLSDEEEEKNAVAVAAAAVAGAAAGAAPGAGLGSGIAGGICSEGRNPYDEDCAERRLQADAVAVAVAAGRVVLAGQRRRRRLDAGRNERRAANRLRRERQAAKFMRDVGRDTEEARRRAGEFAEKFLEYAAANLLRTMQGIHAELRRRRDDDLLRQVLRGWRLVRLERQSVSLCNRRRLRRWLAICGRLRYLHRGMPVFATLRTKRGVWSAWLSAMSDRYQFTTPGLLIDLRRRRLLLAAYDKLLADRGIVAPGRYAP